MDTEKGCDRAELLCLTKQEKFLEDSKQKDGRKLEIKGKVARGILRKRITHLM